MRTVTLTGKDEDEMLLLGNFNIPGVQWIAHDKNDNVFLLANFGAREEVKMIDELADYGLFQLIEWMQYLHLH